MNRAIVAIIAIGAVALLAAIGALAPLAANAGPAPSSSAALLGPDAPVQHTPYNPQSAPVPPAPTSVTYWGVPASDDTYEYYETLGVAVRFSEAVTVTGVPYLELIIGSAVKKANYHSGAGTAALRFQYRVANGDSDANGFSVNYFDALKLNGGAIKSVANATIDAGTSFRTVSSLPGNDARHKVSGVNSVPSFGTATVDNLVYTPGQLIPVSDLPAATGGNGALTYSLNQTTKAPPCGTATDAPVNPIPDWMSYYPPGATYNGATVARNSGGKIAPNGTTKPETKMSPTCFELYAADADGDNSATDRAVLSFSVTVLADYDSDDNGLLEVSSLAQLDAIRYDLNGDGDADNTADDTKYAAAFPNPVAGMGCQLVDHDDATIPPAPVCTGYELTQNLDFDTDDDGATYTVSSTGAITGDAGDTYYNGGQGWTPIAGVGSSGYSATFDGKGNTIANLFIHRTTADTDNVGLFGLISATGAVKKLGLTNVSITSQSRGAGTLAGHNAGAIANCYATGALANTHNSGTNSIGGLVGNVRGGTITNSYAAVAVSGRNRVGPGRDRIGGLVGNMTQTTGAITASYATGAVSSDDDRAKVGGLVGNIWQGPAITSSYATGAVFGSGRYSSVGGLVGGSGLLGGSITASYAAGTVSGGSHSEVGGLAGRAQDFTLTDSYAIGAVSGGSGSSTSGLGNSLTIGITNTYWDAGTTGQSLTGPGSLADQGKTTRDLQSPTSNTGIYAGWQTTQWDFGTARQYPAVKHNGKEVPGQRQTSIQSDHWNAPVVGERVTAGLNVTGATSITWQWQSSPTGATWTNIAGAATATYIPVAADAASGGKFLRAQVTFTVSGQTQTLTTVNTAKVIAATTATAARTTAAAPMVGLKLRYQLSGVTAANRTNWRWQRCDDAAMTANCQLRAQSNPIDDAHTEYTPAAGTDTDVGKYLRAYVYYADSGNSNAWTRTQTPVLGPVVAAPAPAPAP